MIKKHGFTLIELLIVIVIMGILAAIITTNLFSARQRAQDSQKKSGLNQLQVALHSYFVNYHKYPNNAGNNGFNFYACGVRGQEQCLTGNFTADGVEYMGKLPQTSTGQNDFRYYPCGGGDDYRLKINLDIASDADIAASQLKCPANTCAGQSLSYGVESDYVLCGD